ncbi:DNA-binding response regulator, OmpR family, contains REC and winged-helix (wHTH) domain [Duganella sp. CF517]|uniref:response regulator transcription factor n=1 Tax=Duganella sp. CF517 TaxID=1881038 RepID=UPI0008AABC13|nr:response regulator transcription factor [Duganella sp. CF517]SEN65326.1 DNA-binding response regulator, OmpR family, contains REC and winged-helix (wHTH) domain [Duganella sp. CF517]
MSPGSLTILVVEDHPTIARQIVDFLDGLKWQTDHAATGALAIDLATRETYDVILLDLNLPDIDGIDVCRAIKARAPRNVPVLMLTARDAFEDKARGFNGGADDYLTKPFDLRELALRCEALARRGQLHVGQALRVGPLTLLTRERRALHNGTPVPLTQAGFKILSALCAAQPHAVSRSALTHALWGTNPPDSDALKSHIYALRKQLQLAGAPDMIVTIPQLGYRLALEAADHV